MGFGFGLGVVASKLGREIHGRYMGDIGEVRRGRLEAGQRRRVGDGPAVAHHRQRRAAHLGIGIRLGIGIGIGIGIGMGMRIGIRIGLGLALGFAHRAVHALGGAI